MIVLALAAAAAVFAHGLHWEGKATVHAAGKTIPIGVRTTIGRDGKVVSDSWPMAEGEKKGLRRMSIDAGGGWLERNGKRDPLPGEMVVEERMQYGFYRQLQDASAWCRRHPSRRGPHLVGGLAETSFTCRRGVVASATNRLAPGSEGSQAIDQRFTFAGWWDDRGLVFPRHMELTRSGEPYFTLDITRFDAR